MKTIINTLTIDDLAKVEAIVTEQLNVSREQVTPDAKFIEDLGADSLDMVEISMQLEEVFNIVIPDEESEKVRSVDDLYELLSRFVKRA